MNLRRKYGLLVGAVWELNNLTLIYWFISTKQGVCVTVVLKRPNVYYIMRPSSTTKKCTIEPPRVSRFETAIFYIAFYRS